VFCGLIAQANLTPEAARSWLDVFEKYGVALVSFVVLSVLLVIGIVKVCSYLSTRILEPLADRHIRFLDRTERCIETQTDCVQRVEVAISAIAKKQDEHFEICRSGTHPKPHPRPA
jgi:hypothetical protein